MAGVEEVADGSRSGEYMVVVPHMREEIAHVVRCQPWLENPGFQDKPHALGTPNVSSNFCAISNRQCWPFFRIGTLYIEHFGGRPSIEGILEFLLRK